MSERCTCCDELPAVQREATWWKEHAEEWRARLAEVERERDEWKAKADEVNRELSHMEITQVQCPGTMVGVAFCGQCLTCVTKQRDAARAEVLEMTLRQAIAIEESCIEVAFYAALRRGAKWDAAIDESGIHPNRATTCATKWERLGWWDYGVTIRTGWFTDAAPAALEGK